MGTSLLGVIRMYRKLITVAVFLGLLVSLAPAQVTGRLSGTVADSSGAAVPNAQVQLLLPGGKSAVWATTTAAEGLYVFTGVRPGTYDVDVVATGFVASHLRGVKVDPIRETSLPAITLE